MSMYDNESGRQTPRYSVRGETYVDETLNPVPGNSSPSHYPIYRNAPDFQTLDIVAFAVTAVMILGPLIVGASHWGVH